MMLRVLPIGLLCVLTLTASLAIPSSVWAQAKYGDAEFACVADKQRAAGEYAGVSLQAWAQWEWAQNDAKLAATLARGAATLAAAFASAETASAEGGVDCVEQTATAVDLATEIDAAVLEMVEQINTGLDLTSAVDAKCGNKLISLTGRTIDRFLSAESAYTNTLPLVGDSATRDATLSMVSKRFSRTWAGAACGTEASADDIETRIAALSRAVILRTVVAQGLDDSEFQPLSPVGPIEYEGKTLNPRCGFDDDPDYHFFVKRGSVNKLVVYYQGGGACWDNLTCGIPVCKDGADPVSDDPDNATAGFADLSNPDNPFRDWNVVFVTYCTCDVHFGEANQSYSGFFPTVNVSHSGFQNAKTVEKFARENFLNPEVVFVTGSSAGGYGALFHGPLLHEVWPQAEFKVLGDASNGVITPEFLQNEFNNWNFSANLPDDVPGVVESITSGEGMVAYTEAVATHFPESAWANYTTAYDGGSGGQTGFYNVMLNNSNPAAALTWWEASCQFNEAMVAQTADTFGRLPSNYRYYIDSGSRHTVYGSNTVYTGQLGGPAQTVDDWVKDMLSFDPMSSASDDWRNAECSLCGVVLAGNPRPPSIPTAPFFNFGALTVISCP